MKHSVLFRFIICILIFSFSSSIFAQESADIPAVSMDDFNEVVSLWNDAVTNDEYQHYIEKIIYITSSEVDKDFYPYMLSEMLFFRFFSTQCSSMPVFTELNKKADEIIDSFINFESDSTATYIAHKLFEVVNRFYLNDNDFPSAKPLVSTAAIELPDPFVERKKLLNAINEAESMYVRFLTMLSNQAENVTLRFSEEAYKKTMNNPALVYVIENEPTYALLKEALEKSDDMIDTVLLEDDVELYYSFVDDLTAAKKQFTKWGIPINLVLTDDISTLFLVADTDPFILLCLDSEVINNTEIVIKYLSLFSDMYISRVNSLMNHSGR